MEENRESFIFHRDWYLAIRKQPKQLQAEIYDAIMEKVFDGTQKELSDIASVVMDLISPQIDRDKEKWLTVKEKRREAGKLGGLAKQANATKCYQMLPNATDAKQSQANLPVSVSVSDSVSVDNNSVILKEKEDKKKIVKFVKPTVDEVQAYIVSKGYHFSAEAFFAHYESNGWHVGRNPMKNWRMACATWEHQNSYYGKDRKSDSTSRQQSKLSEFASYAATNLAPQGGDDTL